MAEVFERIDLEPYTGGLEAAGVRFEIDALEHLGHGAIGGHAAGGKQQDVAREPRNLVDVVRNVQHWHTELPWQLLDELQNLAFAADVEG